LSSRRRALAWLLLPLCAARAWAEEPQPAAAPDRRAEELVVTGVRTGELEDEPTAFGERLRTEAFEAERRSLADLLSEVPGVFVRRFGSAGDPSEISIRGSSAQQVVVAIDGVRANSALSGGVDLTSICLPLVEEVRIARGAGATREGSGAVGGVVEITTRAPGAEPELRVGGSGGAFDTWEGSLFGAGRMGPLDLSLGYCGLTSEGDFEFARPEYIGPGGLPAPFVPDESQRINNEQRQHGATLAAGLPLGPGELRFGNFFVHAKSGEPGFDCCNGEDAGQNPEAESTAWSNLAQLRFETGSLGGAHRGLRAALYQRSEDREYRDPLQLFGDPLDVDARIGTWGARLENGFDLTAGPTRHAPGFALELARDHFSSDDAPTRERIAGALRLDDRISLWQQRVLLVPALRADWTERFGREWIPALGLVVTPLRWLRLRANATRAFRVPSFDELYLPDQGYIGGNPELDPEEAWNFDTGFELVLDQLGPLADLRLSAGVFRREIDESIVWVPVSPTRIEPVNTGEATAQGVELGLGFRVTDFVRLQGSFTELDSERDATGERLPGQPEREASARLQLGPPDAWKLVGELLYTDELLVSEGGGRYLPDRTVWNASAALNLASLRWLRLERLVPRLWVFFRVDNLSDEAVRDTLAFPQPGRAASAGFEASW
jgi:outer membrane cobalamin receptor